MGDTARSGEEVHPALTGGQRLALEILSDGEPHATWGRATNLVAHDWKTPEILGVLNANVASRLVERGLAHYRRCTCCGAFLGVVIGAEDG